MKKNFKTTMFSCLAGVALLVCGVMPVRAMGPGSDCPHENFALSLDVPTGEYEYLESGHYQVWGIGHLCMRCDYNYYTDTHLVFECYHDWESLPSEVYTENGVNVHVYDCKNSECDRHYIATTQVVNVD